MEISMQPLHLETVTAGADCAVLRIGGDIDVYSAPQLRDRIIQLLGDGIRHIIADLRQVDFLDSTGLGVLVGGLKRLREQDGSLKLVTNPGRIAYLLRLTGLNRIFAPCQSVLQAMADDRHWEAALTSEDHSSEEWCREHELL
jgi:anti-sigma B factor antagonist